MRLAFVRPSMSGRASADALQPLVFSLIKALTPAGVEITFHDEMAEPLPRLDADAVALTVQTFTARRAYQVADECRARGIPVVMGGFHPTAVPDECAEHADAVVVGEAEDTWAQVVADLVAGRVRPRYVSRNDADLTLIGDDTAWDRHRYPPLGLVQFSRGCRYTCEFCSIVGFFGHTVRTKPLDVALAEVARRPETHLFFVDDNLFADRERARALFEGLVGLGKRWVCQISMDVAEDPALLRLMHRAGCFMVLVGFESLDGDNLRQMRKGANLRARDYEPVLARLREAGLMVYGTFVVGYDHDTASSAAAAAAFARAHGFAIANVNPLMPMPGTPLFTRLAAEGRLLQERWWLDEDFHYGDAMFTPVRMSPAELTDSCRAARFSFYSPASIASRALAGANRANPTNLGIHLTANLISAREIRAKQGAALGLAGVGS